MHLHMDDAVFKETVLAAAHHFNIPELYIEKDYWVTLLLFRLSQYDLSNQLIFKGGTALAKASRIIERFSEDIDLAVLMPGCNGNQIKTFMKNAETRITSDLVPLPGHAGESKGSIFRKTYYRYPQHFQGEFGQASQSILLEISAFSLPEPVIELQIGCLVGDFLRHYNHTSIIEQYQLQTFPLLTLSVERTLIEKVVALVKAARSAEPEKQLKLKIRHIYDICMILRHEKFFISLRENKLNTLLEVVIENDLAQFKQAGNWFELPLNTIPIFSLPDQYWHNLKDEFYGAFIHMVYHQKLPDDKEVIAALNAIQRLLTHYQLQAGMHQA